MGGLARPEVSRYDTIDSTNDECVRLLRAGRTPPFAVLARRQTAGRGRRGRTWTSLAGDNVHLSLLARTSLAPAAVSGLTLDVGVAVAGTIARVCAASGVSPRLKWPNDVLIGGRKVAGILCELHDEVVSGGGAGRFVVIGVGVDVADSPLPEPIAETAVSLAQVMGAPMDEVALAAFEEALVEAIFGAAVAYEARGRPDVERWSVSSDTLGARVRSEPDRREGRVTGIASDGSLLLLWDGRAEAEPFIAGDLVLVG